MRNLIFIAVLCATLTAYLALLLWSLPQLSATANGLPMFDLRPTGYSFEEAAQILRALGADGIAFYLGPQHMLDSIYPPLLALTLALSFQRLYQGLSRWGLMGLAGLAGGFDLLENIAVAAMLEAGPEQLTTSMASTANLFTCLKSGAVTLAMLALLFGLGRWAWRRYSGRASRQFSTSSRAS